MTIFTWEYALYMEQLLYLQFLLKHNNLNLLVINHILGKEVSLQS